MDPKTQNKPQANDLREFDFEDIMTDDIAGEPAEDAGKAQGEKKASPREAKVTSVRKKDADSPSSGKERPRDEDVPAQESKPKGKEEPEKPRSSGKGKAERQKLSLEMQQVQVKRRRRYLRRRAWKISTDMLGWIKDIALIFLLMWVVQTYIAGFITVEDRAMEPFIRAEEHIVFSRFSYRFSEPGRGEVVVFSERGDDSKLHISRVIGLPGDVIQIDSQGKIKVNGIDFKTTYCDGTTTYIPGQISYPYVVPEGHYYLLCDNPSGTYDSRFREIGAVDLTLIKGKVFFYYWPRESWRPIAQGFLPAE